MAQFIQVMLGLGVLSSKASPGNSDPPGTTVQVPSKVRPSCAPISANCGFPVPEEAKEDGKRQFSGAWSDRIGVNGFKLKEGKFRFDLLQERY